MKQQKLFHLFIKLSLLLIFNVGLLLFWNINKALAINNCNDGWQIAVSQTKQINCHGVCKKVTNNCSKAIFVPTKTSSEWSEFRINHPSCANLSNCNPPQAPVISCTPYNASQSYVPIYISWNDVSGEKGYEIYRCVCTLYDCNCTPDDEIGWVGENETFYWDRDVILGYRYGYRVRAWNEAGESWSNIVYCTSRYGPYPDLIVSNIWFGSDRKVHYTVKNQGDATAETSYSRLFVGGEAKDSDDVNALSPKTSRSEYFTNWTCVPGASYPAIEVCVDYYDYIPEKIECNNCMTKSLTCPGGTTGKPDLIITDIRFGSDKKVYYTIKNQGNASAGTSYSRLYINGSSKTTDYVSSLSAGSSKDEYFSGWTCAGGTSYSVKVCADTYDNVSESNEGNNCRTETLTCPETAKPDLIITDIWFNSEGKVEFTVKNQGNASISSFFYVDLFVNNSSNYVDYVTINSLSAGSSVTKTMPNWQCSSGQTYSIKVVADSTDSIDESNENNNDRTENLTCPGTACTNECSYTGQTDYRCSGDWVQKRTCGNYDADPCLEWSDWSNYENCASKPTDCGYGSCDSDERPDWYCSGGSCKYSCYYDSSCVTPSCSGTVNLTLNPSTVNPSSWFTSKISGLTGCDGKYAYHCKDECSFTDWECRGTISGGEDSCSLVAPSSPGTYTYWGCVDKNGDGDFNDPGEKDSATLTVSGGTTSKPDLIITDIWFGSDKHVHYTIKNQGNDSADYSYSELYINGSSKDTDYVGSLSVGESYDTYFSGWTCTAGTSYSVKVCADTYNYVSESNEGNNCRTETLTCPGSPPSSCSGSLSCGTSTQNSITLNYSFSNCGTVKLYKGGSYIATLGSGSKSDSYTVSSLSPGTSYTFYLKEGSNTIASKTCSTQEETINIDLPACPSSVTGSDGIWVNPDVMWERGYNCRLGTNCYEEGGLLCGAWVKNSVWVKTNTNYQFMSGGVPTCGTTRRSKLCKKGNDDSFLPTCPFSGGVPGSVYVTDPVAGWSSDINDWCRVTSGGGCSKTHGNVWSGQSCVKTYSGYKAECWGCPGSNANLCYACLVK